MFRKMRHGEDTRQNRVYCVVEVIIVVLWVGALVLVNYVGRPVERGFYCADVSIRYPHLPDTVSPTLILAVTLLVPLVIIGAVEMACCLHTRIVTSGTQGGGVPTSRSSRRGTFGNNGIADGDQPERSGVSSVGCRVAAALGVYFFGFTVLTLVVVVLKMVTGELRPHFLAVCKPRVQTSSLADFCSSSNNSQYISEYSCTNTEVTEKELLDARKSFPSGHAANAVFMAVFLILYVEARDAVMRRLPVLRLSFYVCLALYAMWVGATRVTDNMHHAHDVAFGALFGLLLALATFFGTASRCHWNCRDKDPEQTGNTSDINNSNNNNNSDNNSRSDEEDIESGNLDHLETEMPTTPTPLLFNEISHTGLRIGPLRLEGDKHKFARRATLQ